MILQVLIAMIAGWINRHQQQVIAYFLEENRTLHAKLGGRRIRFTDAERRRLAALALPIGRKHLTSLATLATPDTLMHWDMLAATDFFTVEVATWHGLVTYYVLVVMDLNTRCVHLAGSTPHPTEAFMMQCARQLTDPFDGFLLDKRYLLHDRDTTFTATFDQFLRDQGVASMVLPPQSPNLNAHCERFIRSMKEEALERMLIIGEGLLRYALYHYLTHSHQEHNHQGRDNQLMAPEPEVGVPTGQVRRRERLGGFLSSYYREAA